MSESVFSVGQREAIDQAMNFEGLPAREVSDRAAAGELGNLAAFVIAPSHAAMVAAGCQRERVRAAMESEALRDPSGFESMALAMLEPFQRDHAAFLARDPGSVKPNEYAGWAKALREVMVTVERAQQKLARELARKASAVVAEPDPPLEPEPDSVEPEEPADNAFTDALRAEHFGDFVLGQQRPR